jgi:hypothetical protein
MMHTGWIHIFVEIIFQRSVRTAKTTQPMTITKIKLLMLFKEIVVYSENHIKAINILCEQMEEVLIVKEGGTYSYHYALKG